MGCGSLRRCKSKNSLSAHETKLEDTIKEYKHNIEKKEYKAQIEKKEYKSNIEKKEYKPNIENEYKSNIKKKEDIDREELQRVYDSLFIVREVSSNLEESPINMLRFKPRVELPRKFSELSRLARQFQKGE